MAERPKVKIVHLEDELVFFIPIKDMLQRNRDISFEYTGVTEPRQALEKIVSSSIPTIVISDIMLTGENDISGILWVIKNLQLLTNRKIPIIFLSAAAGRYRPALEEMGIPNENILSKATLPRTIIDRLVEVSKELLATPQVRGNVFFSYSHRDLNWADKILDVIAPIRETSPFDLWIDRENIEAGDYWKKEIENALDTARIAILLISEAYFQSTFIVDHELPHILQKAENGELTVLWIAVKHSMVSISKVAQYQCLNDPAKPLITYARSEDKLGRELVSIGNSIYSTILKVAGIDRLG